MDIEPADSTESAAQIDSSVTDTTEITEEEKRRAELEEMYKDELQQRFEGRANGVTTFYVNAQRFFYQGRHQAALYHINKAAEIQETSDILALQGSIYLALGNKEKFAEYWRRALEMDENVPIPEAPFVLRELKALGLINENYNPDN